MNRLFFLKFAFISMFILNGCGDPGIAMPKFDPSASASRAMELADSDKNGILSGAELDKFPGLKSALSRVDTNADQGASFEEIRKRVSTYVSAGDVVMPFSATIQFNGAPVVGAEVTFIPEPFLESVISKASGKTDGSGTVSPIVLGLGAGGMLPGMYRVEVSLKDAQGNELLPAICNSQSKTGQEVAVDLPALERGTVISISQ